MSDTAHVSDAAHALVLSLSNRVDCSGLTSWADRDKRMVMKWPFDLPKQKMVLTSRHVKEGAPVYYVSHDNGDGVWQFHPHEKFGQEEADVTLATLKSIYLADVSLGELSDLPQGWHAWRDDPGAPWQREQQPA